MNRSTTAVVAFCVVFVASLSAHQQRAESQLDMTAGSAGLGAVDGHVIWDDGSPVRLATVFLVPRADLFKDGTEAVHESSDAGAAFSDFNGYYHLKGVQPGTYIPRVQKKGNSDHLGLVLENISKFSPRQLQELLSSFPDLTVKSGGTTRRDIVIHKGAAVSGRVNFDIGGVLEDAGLVTATLVSTHLFDPNLGANAHLEYSQTTTPDDRGIYRLSGLPPGQYRIDVRLSPYVPSQMWAIKTRATEVFASLTVFALSALAESGSELVSVDDRDERSDVDITIPFGRLHSVSGMVVRNGEPVPSVSVILHGQQGTWHPEEGHPGASTAADGTFRFDLIPPGGYIVEIEEESGSSGHHRVTHKGAVVVQVNDSDITGATIQLGSQ